jgi:hypothetical protein
MIVHVDLLAIGQDIGEQHGTTDFFGCSGAAPIGTAKSTVIVIVCSYPIGV